MGEMRGNPDGERFQVGVVTRLGRDLERGANGGIFRRRRQICEIDELGARWLCAAVAPGREFAVADDLAALGFSIFCPHGVRLYRRARVPAAWRERRGYAERDYPVFGCYVFVGEPVGRGLRLAKRSHPHIRGVLDEGQRFVPSAFIRACGELWRAGVWDMRARPGLKFRAGAVVRLKEGAFSGFNAIVESLPSETRAVVTLSVFGRPTRATVDSRILEMV